MIDLDQLRLRTYDKDGRLLQAGMTWYEPRLLKIWLLGIPCALSFVVAWCTVPFSLFFWFGRGEAGTLALVAAGSTGVFTVMFYRWFCGQAAHRRTYWRCAAIFSVDDTMLYAKSKATKEPVYDLVQLSPSMVASIEIKTYYKPGYLPHPNLCVDFNLYDGQTITVVRHMPHEHDAKIVSTQINLAFQEIRAAMAAPRTNARRMRETGAAEAPQRVGGDNGPGRAACR
ncbi:MAG: hypothetical protein M5U16_01205 [Hyphomicrobium sp.]|nr:hypothetical protein [Hyphomicrobium sp.]